MALVAAQGCEQAALDAGEHARGRVVDERLDPLHDSAAPTAKPTRQPAIPYTFDGDHSSIATSRAPGDSSTLAARRPSYARNP